MQTIPLKELIISQKGKKPQRISDEKFEDSIPYLDIETLELGEPIRFSDKYSTTISSENDLLIVADGSRSGLVFKGVDGAVGSTMLCLTPIKINRDFLYYFIKSQYLFLTTNKTGDSVPHLNTELFYNLDVPFPPLSEQLKVVQSLEKSWLQFENTFNSIDNKINNKLISEFDFLNKKDIDNLKSEKQSLKDFKNSVLNFLLKENKLFPKVKYKSNIHLKDVVESINYGTAKAMSTEPMGVPILRIPNLKELYIDHTNLKYANLSENEFAKLKLQENDILVIRSNGSINLLGKSCLVTKKEIDFAFAGYLIRIRVKSDIINAKYLNYCLHSPSVRSQIESIDRSSSGVHNINTTELLNIKINFPVLKYQLEISDKIELLLETIAKAEIDSENSKSNLNHLQNSILINAFSEIGTKKDIKQNKNLLEEIRILRNDLEQKLKVLKKQQLLKANEIFMSSKDHDKVIEQIKKFTIKEFGGIKEPLTENQINKIKNYAISTFKDFDYDDFSNIFLELTQAKINNNDLDPFFETVKKDGKISIKIK